ncbi:MAG: hypothetical protein IPK68_09965 [Bdellovibrionales bacterium]|nr:hypothetical protein [Bdellovibrionales bacterium]
MSDVFVIEKKKEILAALASFKSAIRKSCIKLGKRQMMFPGGGVADSVEAFGCTTKHGQLVVGFPDEDWGTRVPIFLNLNPPEKKYAPNVEINIPLEDNRSVSGCFVIDRARHTIVVASRGILTSNKSRISKDLVYAYFKDWLFESTDSDVDSQLISVGVVNSSRLTEDLAEYVAAVNRLKEKIKAGDTKSITTSPKPSGGKTNAWHDGKEFEGKIKAKKKASSSIYDYSHGPIKNSCAEYLKAKFGNELDVKSNVHVDVALVDRKSKKARAIFEIKTTAQLDGQIYQAIGQLLIYSKLYGTENCQKVLVLPERLEAEDRDILLSLGLEICTFEDGKLILQSDKESEFFFKGALSASN